MNVKLLHSMAGDRFSFKANQIIACSNKSGASLVAGGMATEAPANAEIDGTLYDETAEEKLKRPRRKAPKRADQPAAETPEQGAPDHCAGKTSLGNDCKRAPVKGSKFCDKHGT